MNAWTTLLTTAGSDAPAAAAPAPAESQTVLASASTPKRAKRTDVHRPGAIVPCDYVYLTSYSLPGMGAFDPAINLDVARKIWREGTWLDGTPLVGISKERFGALGNCGVCGAAFRHGDIWKHEPSGALVALGHECAEKYELFADRDDWNAILEAQKKNRAAKIEELRRDEAYALYCERHPGLADAIALGADIPENVGRPSRAQQAASILADMKQKIRRWGSISDKQIAFALRLADEIRNPKPVVEEKLVAAPVGEARQIVRGVLVSKKTHESAYGESIKMTVKVSTPDGNWLAWGSMPSGLFSCGQDEDGRYYHAEPGDTVEFAAILKPGREPHFALVSRPTKARLVARKAGA